MNEIKPIKSEADYEKAIALLGELMDKNPAPDTAGDTKIHILSSLIEDYESSTLPDIQANPVEAIKLRMDQLGLKNKDLEPYLGSQSRVSEILAGKRQLTVSMIKNLEEGLGIHATILIGTDMTKKSKRWTPKTLSLMARRGYFGESNIALGPREIIEKGLIRTLFSNQATDSAVLLRQSKYRDIAKIDRYHLSAWTNKVLSEALKIIELEKISVFDRRIISQDSLNSLFKLSPRTDGVLEVINRLKSLGIVVVIEPNLPSIRLDGASIFYKRNPIIGLTLRYDRLDNFWFTLAHELSHVYLHSDSQYAAFYDHLFNEAEETTKVESEADQLAGELLIPSKEWDKSPLRYGSTPTLVKLFADRVNVHESVVAGRIRHDSKNWTTHNSIVNDRGVREVFKDKLW